MDSTAFPTPLCGSVNNGRHTHRHCTEILYSRCHWQSGMSPDLWWPDKSEKYPVLHYTDLHLINIKRSSSKLSLRTVFIEVLSTLIPANIYIWINKMKCSEVCLHRFSRQTLTFNCYKCISCLCETIQISFHLNFFYIKIDNYFNGICLQ